MGKFFKIAKIRASITFGIARKALRKVQFMGIGLDRGGFVAKFEPGVIHVPKTSTQVYNPVPVGPRSALLHELGHAIDFKKGGKKSRKRMRLSAIASKDPKLGGRVLGVLGAKRSWSQTIHIEHLANRAAEKFIRQHSKNPLGDLKVYEEHLAPAFSTYKRTFQDSLSMQRPINIDKGIDIILAAISKNQTLDLASSKSIMRKFSPKNRKNIAKDYFAHKRILHKDYMGRDLG